MGSKFIERNKRRSIFAALLFALSGRGKYVAILLVVTALSVPFVISGETLNSMVELRPIAAFLKSVGLGGLVSKFNPGHANDILKSALEKSAEDSKADSFWARFLKSVNPTPPPGGGPSSIAMVRGGGDFGPAEIKDDKVVRGRVKGVVNAEERARGENGGDVDLEGLLSKMSEGGGLYGSIMAEGPGDGGGGSGPYLNGSMMDGPGGVGDTASGMYGDALSQAGSKVPVPGSPQKIRSRAMGRVSGFSWKNAGYSSKKAANPNLKTGNKKPMFQLAETFAMTGAAYNSTGYEYQAAYTGSTYDGNKVDGEVIQTDTEAPGVPAAGYAGDLLSGVTGSQDQADVCADAQGDEGANMSEDANKMDDTAKTLGKPPKCCNHGAVSRWNKKIDSIIAYCNDFNANQAPLATACQENSSPMDCSSYSGMKIKPCSWLMCILAILLMALLIGFFIFLIFGGLMTFVMATMTAVALGGFSVLFSNPLTSFLEGAISSIAKMGQE